MALHTEFFIEVADRLMEARGRLERQRPCRGGHDEFRNLPRGRDQVRRHTSASDLRAPHPVSLLKSVCDELDLVSE